MTDRDHPDVLEALAGRAASGSGPGERDDEFRIALAIEGGGNRSAYSAGMAMAIDELGLTRCFDDVYGTSGGALNAAWLLTGEASTWLPSWAWADVAAAGVTNPRRLLRGGSLVDLRVLVEQVYTAITPMDFDAILANPVGFHPVATDARTGDAADLAPYVRDRGSLQAALRASACMPLLAGPPVGLGGRRFVDGGLAEAVPWPMAVAQGATHVLVLRTRREDQTASVSRVERLVLAPYFLRHGRGAGRSHARRHLSYGEADVTASRSGASIVQIRPPADAHHVSRLGNDLEAIATAISLGRDAALATLPAVPAS